VQVGALTLAQAREVAERDAIEKTLLRQRGRLSQAAEDLQISRVTFYRLMRAHGKRSSTGDDVVDGQRATNPSGNRKLAQFTTLRSASVRGPKPPSWRTREYVASALLKKAPAIRITGA
jgi:hypothetical protein